MKMKSKWIAGILAVLCLFLLNACTITSQNAPRPAPTPGVSRTGTNMRTGTGVGYLPGNRVGQGTGLGMGAGTLTRSNTGTAISSTGSATAQLAPQRISAPQNLMTINRQKADKIRAGISKIPQVKNANVVVSGNTALVGYTPSAASKNTTATKDLVSKRVKQLDKTITTVVVSESGDIIARISKLAKDMTSNKTASEITGEFNQIVQKIIPKVR